MDFTSFTEEQFRLIYDGIDRITDDIHHGLAYDYNGEEKEAAWELFGALSNEGKRRKLWN